MLTRAARVGWIVRLALAASTLRILGGCALADDRLSEVEGIYVGPEDALLIVRDGAFELKQETDAALTGRVRRDGQDIVLSPRPPARSLRFTPVSWGPRRYLVPTERLLDFCNAVNLGDEPEAFLRHGDGRRPAEGLPRLPAPWSVFLRTEPLVGTLVETLPSGRARIDRGGRDGVFPGMRLYVLGATPEETWLDGDFDVLVIEVAEATAVVERYAGAAGFRVCSSRVHAQRLLYGRNPR